MKAKQLKTLKNLKLSLKDESEAVKFYPKAAAIARKGKVKKAAKFFMKVVKDERKHKDRIQKLLKKLG